MDSMLEQCGYDLDFVDLPSENLKCIVCQLVLKDPVQIMKCGHRYCEMCFERIKNYSNHVKSALCCPVDREEIDVSQVFKDTGMKRSIADLHVKCTFHIHGCSWAGELRNFEEHKKKCNYATKETVRPMPGSEVSTFLLKDVCERLSKCEEAVLEKEKDLAHLKFNLQEVKENVKRRDKEIDLLKLKNVKMELEINALQDANKTLQENIEKISQSAKLQESIKALENGLKDTQVELREGNHEIERKQNSADKSLSEIKEQVKDLSGKVEQGAVTEVFKEVNELKALVNMTNGLLSLNNISCKSTSFVWTICNFREKFDAGRDFESHKFCCRPKGHLGKLFAQFEDDGKSLHPGFRLVKGENSPDVAEFNMNISCDILYNDGSKVSHTISSQTVDHYRKQCFSTLYAGNVTVGLIFLYPLEKHNMNEYLIDDTCTIICTLTPPV